MFGRRLGTGPTCCGMRTRLQGTIRRLSANLRDPGASNGPSTELLHAICCGVVKRRVASPANFEVREEFCSSNDVRAVGACG